MSLLHSMLQLQLFVLSLVGILHCYCHGLYDDADSSNVVMIQTSLDFDKRVLQSDGIWMVQFFDPSNVHSVDFAPKYERLSHIFKGIVHIGAVDAVTTQDGQDLAGRYNVKGYPTMYVFGYDKTNPQMYQGTRDETGMGQMLLSAIMETVNARGKGQPPRNKGPSKVVELTRADFDERVLHNPQVSMVAFISPGCPHCVRLLPEWTDAADRLANEDVLIGVVDATIEQDLAADYGISAYPTIKVFPGGLNKGQPMDYHGPRGSDHIYDYALAEIVRSGVPKEIDQLTSADVLEQTCTGQNRICVLAVLPHILDSGAQGRNKYRDMLSSVAKTFRGSSAYSFLWSEGGSQPQLEEAMEMTFGYPALVALSLDRQAYALHRGSFSEKAITGFLQSITTGRQATTKLVTMPGIVDVDAWDGKDGTPLEEEPPLSEIMGDDFVSEL